MGEGDVTAFFPATMVAPRGGVAAARPGKVSRGGGGGGSFSGVTAR
jgi:hypothetical protein